VDDGAGGEDLAVEELDGARAGGAKQGLAAFLDDGEVFSLLTISHDPERR